MINHQKKITIIRDKKAKIRGKVVEYDMCSSDVTQKNRERKNYRYLGKGKIHSIRGIKQEGKKSYLFWIYEGTPNK